MTFSEECNNANVLIQLIFLNIHFDQISDLSFRGCYVKMKKPIHDDCRGQEPGCIFSLRVTAFIRKI